MARPAGVDRTEARARLRRERSRFRRAFFDLDEVEWTDGERRAHFEAVFEQCWRGGMSRQEVADMVGQAAGREGKSFDESLNAYYLLYAKRKRQIRAPRGAEENAMSAKEMTFKVTGINEYRSGDGWVKSVTLTEDGAPEGQTPVAFSLTIQSGDASRYDQFTRDGGFTLTPTKAAAK